ncbi:MAG: terminase large subunit domain-containing protein [Candidatus Aminicenantales bacterium]
MPTDMVYRDIELPYRLLPWQKRVKEDLHRFKVIVAGGRSGKTTLAVDWLTTEAPQDDMRLGDSVSFYVAPTYSQAEDIAWGKLKDNIRPLRANGLVKRIYEGDMSIELFGGQWIQLKGGDKPDSLRGVKVRRLVLDEMAIMKRELWEEVLQPRTSDYLAPVMFIGTPKGFNYFYDLSQMELKNPQDWKTFHVKTAEAGTLAPDEIARAQRDMDPRAFRQEYEASFETFGGQVYTDFDRDKHVAKEPFGFNPGMQYAVGMDFGWSATMPAILCNIDTQENVYIFGEIARRETAIPVMGQLIKDKTPGHLPSLIAGDPAGAAKNEASGLDSISELRAIFGFNAVRYRANYPGVIQDGINVVRKWLRNGKIKISRDCVNTIQAFEMYRYPDPKGDVQSELPLKDGISDHYMDGFRYLMAYRFPLRKSTMRAA